MGEAKRRQLAGSSTPTEARYSIKIDFLFNGQIRMTGPLNQPKICEAMLKDAMTIVTQHYPASLQPKDGENQIIQPNQQIILPGV